MKLCKPIILLFTIIPFFSQSQSSQLIFAKVYGYIKYFYPSDEATQIDWNQFAVYGVEKTSSCKSQKELIDSLTKIFKPVAPLLIIQNKPVTKNITITEKEEMVMWLHNGNGIDKNSTVNPYKTPYSSKRVSSKVNSSIFKQKKVKYNYQIYNQLSDSVYISFPIKLNIIGGKTLPVVRSEKLKWLQNEMKLSPTQDVIEKADLIVAWNALKHFYPYQNTLKINWDSILIESIHYIASKPYSSLDVLLENISDGHAIRYKPELLEMFRLPFVVKEIGNQIVVNCSFDPEIQQGDIILKIDDADVKNEMRYAKNFISGSKQKKSFWFPYSLSLDTVPSIAKIKLIRNSAIQYRDIKRIKYEYKFGCKCKLKGSDIHEISKGIFYVDLTSHEWETIEKKLADISNSKGVIIDLRGYPLLGNNKILSYLPSYKNTKKKVFMCPQILYPNYKFVTYKKEGWDLMRGKPFLKNKVVFLINSFAISQSESILAYIKGTKNITIIGSNTAGTNGDIYDIVLPSGEIIMFSGLIATDVNGNTYHNKGIQPDIEIEPSIEDIKNNIDRLIIEAIKYINS